MWYAVEYAYGSNVENNGGRADRVYRFSRRELRDAWVGAGSPQVGPGERAALTARHPLVRKATWQADGDGDGWRVLGEQRLAQSTALAAHKATICYDWPNETEHWRWVATAPEREIISWARATGEEWARDEAMAAE